MLRDTFDCSADDSEYADRASCQPIVLLPVLTYMTVFLGLTPVLLPSFLWSGDYSNGVYLATTRYIGNIISFLPTIVVFPKMGALVLALGAAGPRFARGVLLASHRKTDPRSPGKIFFCRPGERI